MPTHFDLIITADAPSHTAEFRLLDAHGSQLAYRHTDFKTISVSHRQGLFDLRNYLRLYVEEGKELAAVVVLMYAVADLFMPSGIKYGVLVVGILVGCLLPDSWKVDD